MKLGMRFYDEFNARYLTIDAVHRPHIYMCIVEELNEDGDDYEVTDRQLFTEGELKHFKKL